MLLYEAWRENLPHDSFYFEIWLAFKTNLQNYDTWQSLVKMDKIYNMAIEIRKKREGYIKRLVNGAVQYNKGLNMLLVRIGSEN